MSTEKLTYSREWTDAEAFPRLGFTKNWENPADYPTIETDEAKVRQDMQSLHDETKNYINETLIPAILAEDATEEARIAAESTREENERSRVQAEQTRVANENARIQAEAAREAAEKQRQSAISGQVASTAQSAASAAQSATAAAASKAEAEKLVAQAQQTVENAATVEIGTVTEGDTMSVTNVGTKRAAKLNFVLRRGAAGADGESGATFTPAVSAAGDLSWSNDKGLANPATVNIKGRAGSAGKDGADGKSAYAYAQEGGYEGTEDEFKSKLAAEYAEVDHTHIELIPFVATYGSTSFSDVYEAYKAGRDVFIESYDYDSLATITTRLYLSEANSSAAFFAKTMYMGPSGSEVLACMKVKLTSDDTWSSETKKVEATLADWDIYEYLG